MSEIVDFNAARKRRRIRAIYQTTEDNLDGSPWLPDGDDHMVYRACGYTLWKRFPPPPLRAPISPPTARVPHGGTAQKE